MPRSQKDEEPSMLRQAVNTALLPARAVTSKPAQRAYVGTILFGLASIVLLGASTLAFLLFYNSYVPQLGVEEVVHLQFGSGSPHGTTSISPGLTAQQPYDITLTLHLPRTPSNLAVGNFMLDLALLAPSAPSHPASVTDSLASALHQVRTHDTPGTAAKGPDIHGVLARSRRPAILTYASPLIATTHSIVRLAWYVLGWRGESERLRVPMFEGVVFARGSAEYIPNRARLAIEADTHLQVYEVRVAFRARFQGLRWFLYNYTLTAFVIFSTTFFSVSLTTAACVYMLFMLRGASTSETDDESSRLHSQIVKREDSALSQNIDPSTAISTPRDDIVSSTTDPLVKIEPGEQGKTHISPIHPLLASHQDEVGIGTARDERGSGSAHDASRRRTVLSE